MTQLQLEQFYQVLYMNSMIILPQLISAHSPPLIVKEPPTGESLFQVVTQQSENNRPFLIECEAEGEPAPV